MTWFVDKLGPAPSRPANAGQPAANGAQAKGAPPAKAAAKAAPPPKAAAKAAPPPEDKKKKKGWF